MTPRPNTTRFVILGILSTEESASGYDIRQFVALSIGHFWQESFGQIYPELARLDADGLIAPVRERRTAGNRSRKRYQITPHGRVILKSWLQQPAAPSPVRLEYLLKIFFGRAGGLPTTRSHIAGIEKQATERARAFAAIAPELLQDSAADPDLVFALLTLRHGYRTAEARLQWAREAEALLRAFERGGNRGVAAAWKKLPALEAYVDESP